MSSENTGDWAAARAEPLARRLVSVVLDDPEPLLWGGEALLRDGRPVGDLTSAAYGHTVGAAVALGYARRDDGQAIDAAWLESGRFEVDLAGTRERIDALASSRLAPDAELAWLEAHAELLIDEGETEKAAAAFRELGAALWDMADDRPRALTAWLRAAQLDSARGYATLRRDLTTFANERYAVDCLSELVERETAAAQEAREMRGS